MKFCRLALALFFVVLLTLSCTACDAGAGRSVAVRREVAKASKPCPVTPSFVQETGVQPTPVPGGDIAPSYQQISSRLKELSSKANDANYEAVKDEANSFLRQALYQKGVSRWQGWIVSTGVEALRSLQVKNPFGGYGIDDDLDTTSGAVLLSMVDPFVVPTEVITSTARQNWSEYPYVVLTDAREISGQPLCIGQQVSFDGIVADSPEIIYSRGDIMVSQASVTVINNGLSDRTLSSDLKNVVIKMLRIGGWGSPVYQAILFGDGTVALEDKSGRLGGGFKIATVKEDVVRQLLDQFTQADFFSMSNYDKRGVSDSAYTRLTLNTDGKRHSVLHYYGNDTPAEQITKLEKSIYHIIAPFNWVGSDYEGR